MGATVQDDVAGKKITGWCHFLINGTGFLK